MTVKSNLQQQSTSEELNSLLTELKPRLLAYVEESDPKSSKYNPQSLGTFHEPKFLKQQFIDPNNDLNDACSQQELFETIDKVLKYSVNTWNPGFLDKLYASNNPIGVVSDILLSMLNTNSHVYTVSPVLSVLENYIGKKYAQLFFHTETCGGLTFSGGSWSNITSLQLARSLKFPDTKTKGNGDYKFALYTSKHCHYSVEKAAILLGIGSENVFKVDVDEDGVMDVSKLEAVIEETKSKGYTPLYINATAGTTVFGSYDPFMEISKIAKKHNIHFHIDGSWGGNVIFSEKYKDRLNGSQYADSITVNPHKMLGIPNTCSFLLLPQVANFQTAMSLKAPYLFHGRESGDDENYDLADGTMGCGRRSDAFKFYLGWLYYGQKGFAERVDHAYSIMEYFVQKIKHDGSFEIVGPQSPQCLQVCFYYHPSTVKDKDNTTITRYISRELHKLGKYLVDFSPNPVDDTQGEFFRVVFNSPALTTEIIDDLIASIVKVGKELE
ncbi:dtxS4 L-aspartate decarboxylase dtxS4 [Candida maltosa Xu316]|uniref:G1utamic acid decarboxylase, putative n=1 Tax=Candida maltosa (strain Xu316) TaxID=1245528 RepID=M3HQX0_CANMX|nr:G1utamic acid decarboxylase, putative [Candida maltosa Xu316]